MPSLDFSPIPLFAGFTGEQFRQIAPYFAECRFEPDCLIFRQEQPAEFLYVLLAGAVVIHYKPYDGPPLTVARITPGGVFGWSAALRREVYTSGATAAEPSTALCIRGASLPVLCARHPETGAILLDRLAGVIAERLRSTHTQVLEILTRGVASQNPR